MCGVSDMPGTAYKPIGSICFICFQYRCLDITAIVHSSAIKHNIYTHSFSLAFSLVFFLVLCALVGYGLLGRLPLCGASVSASSRLLAPQVLYHRYSAQLRYRRLCLPPQCCIAISASPPPSDVAGAMSPQKCTALQTSPVSVASVLHV